MKTKPVVIICPGNGCSNIRNSNWYGRLFHELNKRDISCVCENFPDPLHARRDRWVPHMRSLAEKYGPPGCPEDIVLVGHSSGAQASLRYAELYPVQACILVSATYSDLGDAHERASGYYPQKEKGDSTKEINPYEFSKMKTNCKIWHQFHSDDDPFIPVSEAKAIQNGLGLTDNFHLLPGRSHFFDFQPEILESVLSVC
mmetsp:Transcript_11709/g.33669  ORF Transcript_11709/g.33669 Transcript_11709/m.33669 type:complete len:200 (-) Transcript_11709:1330-1929(-)